jgi:hypothetical protein
MMSTTLRIVFKTILQAGLALAIAAGLASLGFSKDIEDCIESLRSWEQLKKKVNFVEVRLPGKIDPISVSKDDARRDFAVGVALFESTWSDEVVRELRGLARESLDGQPSNARVLQMNDRLKDIRGSLKTLRFLYEALSADHKCPPAIDELTTAIGKLRDCIQGKRGSAADIPPAARRLLKALKEEQVVQVEDELRAFEPSRRPGFDRWVKDTVRETEEILSRKKGPASDFHDARKNLQCLLAVYEVEMEFHPENREWEPVARFLLQETENIGDANEDWERQDSRGNLNYKKDGVRYPRELAQVILAFLHRIRF